MTCTKEDYQRVADDFVQDMAKLGDDVVSVVLYGSLVRGDVRPGLSDIMDAFLFLRHEVFQDKARYLHTLNVMVEASERLSRHGIPFHPFFYWDDASPMPAIFYLTFVSDKSSKPVLGADLRPQLRCSPASVAFARNVFFEFRRQGHQGVIYLSKDKWEDNDVARVINILTSAKKYLTMMACWALDLWVALPDTPAALQKAFPQLDMSVLGKIEPALASAEAAPEVEKLREIFMQTFEFIENLHDVICEDLRSNSSPHFSHEPFVKFFDEDHGVFK
jgi:predicted nucleotidyltransferase